MGKKFRIRTAQPWVGYSGSTVQQNYAEDLDHGYILWNIEDRDKFNASFRYLVNPQPFVTVDWCGDPSSTVQSLLGKYPTGTRFRVKSDGPLHQHDVIMISKLLKDQLNASEVTFKTSQQINKELIIRTHGSTAIVKNDLRNADILIALIKEYSGDRIIDEATWSEVAAHVSRYVSAVNADVNDIARNVRWTLRHLSFDNMFAYGEGNVIDFDKLDGIVGIFGSNRSGKSSIVGTIMYALFNSTDRGSIKNMHVVNVRKPFGYARAVINVDGSDFVIERQTTKVERKNQLLSTTALNVFKIVDGAAVDLAGEQRNDTEKVIRNLIGTPDDFLLTSMAVQDEMKMFISYGSTKRRQVISRFLDLDIFDRLYEQVKVDFNIARGAVRSVGDVDSDDSQLLQKIDEAAGLIIEHDNAVNVLHGELTDLRARVAAKGNVVVVTAEQLKNSERALSRAVEAVESCNDRIDVVKRSIVGINDNVAKIDSVISDDEIERLEIAAKKHSGLTNKVTSVAHQLSTEETNVNRATRSIKLLAEVPCGDQFPTCKFIKDAHVAKANVEAHRRIVDELKDQLQQLNSELSTLDDPSSRLEKHRKLRDMRLKFLTDRAAQQEKLNVELRSLDEAIARRDAAKTLFEQQTEAFSRGDSAEVLMMTKRIDEIVLSVKEHDRKKLTAATEKGRLLSALEQRVADRKQRDFALKQMRALEVIMSAFSRKGIPLMITKQQLPMINAEISQILQGIVDFTIELETDDDSDMTEVYINYGDSRRLIELCSGMEKMIASVAIRVALINVSSLPKTNMFVIDEGFGALDEMGVEACNRLLVSLKKYFKTVIVITHVEGVKDAADTIIELSKREKDAVCVYA